MMVAAQIADAVSTTLGLGEPATALSTFQVVLRGLVVYVSGVVMVRLAPRRFMGRHSPFDLILSILLGAVLARAVNGTAPFVPTLAVGFALVLLDRLFAAASYRWSWFRSLVEGKDLLLVCEGEVSESSLRRAHLSSEDLRAALRRSGHVRRPEEVAEARIERGGEVSVIPRGDR